MPPDMTVELTNAIISALPAAALAVLFALFALVIVIVFIRFLTTMLDKFIATSRDEAERNRVAQAEQAARWRADVQAMNQTWAAQFSQGMARFSAEMGQINANVRELAGALGAHDRTMQVGMAGLSNAIQVVTKTATGPLKEK